MRIRELKEKVRETEKVLGDLNLDFYVSNIWENEVVLQGFLSQEARRDIEKAGFVLVRTFRTDGATFYTWQKDGIRITLHTQKQEEGGENEDKGDTQV